MFESLDHGKIPKAALARFNPVLVDTQAAAGLGWMYGVCQKEPQYFRPSPTYDKATRFVMREAYQWGVNIGRQQLGLANSWQTESAKPIGNRPRTAAIV